MTDSTVTHAGGNRADLADTLLHAATEGAEAGSQSLATLAGADRYEVGEEIGRGGMGRVHAALDRQFGREVAVKSLLGRASEAARERMLREALITANLEHPGVTPVYERGDADGVPFYSMRRVRGKTLGEVLEHSRDLGERLKLVAPLVHVAQTVGFAHSHGVVHRDLKPDNILVGRHGETFVLDWGIAKVRGVPTPTGDGEASVQAAASTQAGSVVGTPAYMAPEQAAGKLELVDERSDVFALGAILYHLLAGRPPYSGDDLHKALERIRNADFEPIDRVSPEAPPELRAICARAMAREGGERYASAAEVARALEDFTAEAVARPRGGAVPLIANTVSALLVLLSLVAAFVMWRALPSLAAHGTGVFLILALAALGTLLAGLEFSTRGRHRLSPLVLSLAMLTLMAGVFATVGGMEKVLATAASDPILKSAIDHRAVMTIGTREALGNLGTGSVLCGIQLALWGIARRRAA